MATTRTWENFERVSCEHTIDSTCCGMADNTGRCTVPCSYAAFVRFEAKKLEYSKQKAQSVPGRGAFTLHTATHERRVAQLIRHPTYRISETREGPGRGDFPS